MGALDDFTYAQIAPRLVPGEQILGMAYCTVWDRQAQGGVAPRLGAATDRRLFLIATELERNVPAARNLGITEWWYEDVAKMHPVGVDQAANFEQFAFASRPGFGPTYDTGDYADRISIHGATNLGFSNPIWLRTQFVAWLKPRIDGGGFPQTAARAALREAHFRERNAAAQQQQQRAAVARQASRKVLPMRLAYGAAILALLGAAAIGWGAYQTFASAGRKAATAVEERAAAAKAEDPDMKKSLGEGAESSERLAAEDTTLAFVWVVVSVICLGVSIGGFVLGGSLKKKLAAG
jgi:hypothetical protein